MKKALVLLLPMIMAGCASTVEIEDTMNYKCGSKIIEAEFLDDDTTVLTIDGKRTVLNSTVSASGARYVGIDDDETNKMVFWTDGDETTLEINNREYPKCVELVK